MVHLGGARRSSAVAACCWRFGRSSLLAWMRHRGCASLVNPAAGTQGDQGSEFGVRFGFAFLPFASDLGRVAKSEGSSTNTVLDPLLRVLVHIRTTSRSIWRCSANRVSEESVRSGPDSSLISLQKKDIKKEHMAVLRVRECAGPVHFHFRCSATPLRCRS